jgi:plastocyanin
MLMRKIDLLGLLGMIVVLQSCGGGGGTTGIYSPPSPPPSPGTCAANTLCMQSASFDPSQASVPKGTVVSFTNSSGVTHNIVFDAPRSTGVADIGSIPSGTVTRTFNESGTWNLHCTIHAGMTAQVIVT